MVMRYGLYEVMYMVMMHGLYEEIYGDEAWAL